MATQINSNLRLVAIVWNCSAHRVLQLHQVSSKSDEKQIFVWKEEKKTSHKSLWLQCGANYYVYLGGHLFPNLIMYAKYFYLNHHLLL